MNDQEQQITIEQYKIYTSLYQHEDNLSWTKLHKTVVLSAALLTIYGLAINLDKTLAIFVAIFGVSVSCLFLFATLNGALFLTLRRKNITNIEKKLANIGGQEIFMQDERMIAEIATERGKAFVWPRKMRTSSMLLTFQFLLVLAWFGLIIFACTNNVGSTYKVEQSTSTIYKSNA